MDAQLRLAAVNDSALSSTQRNTTIAYKLGALRDIRHILSRPALARLAKIERVAEEVARAGRADDQPARLSGPAQLAGWRGAVVTIVAVA